MVQFNSDETVIQIQKRWFDGFFTSKLLCVVCSFSSVTKKKKKKNEKINGLSNVQVTFPL